jgi:hypothetical protein
MTLTTKQREIYAKLWTSELTGNPPIPCLYSPPGLCRRASGLFSTHPYDPDKFRPEVWLARAPTPKPRTEPDLAGATLEELLVLAHELGHVRSYRKNERPDGYRHAVDAGAPNWSTLKEHQKAMISDEEVRAWDYARVILTDEGFDDWGAYEEKRANSLGVYWTMLSMSQEEERGE